jgi:hypothetical protein
MPLDETRLPIKGSLVDECDVQESLDYLQATANEAAAARALADVAEMRVKQARAAAMVNSIQTTADRREADALASNGVERAIRAHQAALAAAYEYQNQRRFHELRIEVWRSFNANQRQIKL